MTEPTVAEIIATFENERYPSKYLGTLVASHRALAEALRNLVEALEVGRPDIVELMMRRASAALKDAGVK